MNNLLKTVPWGKNTHKGFLNRESNVSQPLQVLQPRPRQGVSEVWEGASSNPGPRIGPSGKAWKAFRRADEDLAAFLPAV